MRYLAACLFLTLLSSIPSAGQQNIGKQEKEKYVIAPTEKILLVVASQPDSPLRIEEAKYLLKSDGTGRLIWFDVHNISSKAVAHFSVVAWYSDGTGGGIAHPWRERKQPLMPGERFTLSKEELPFEIVPLTGEVKLKLERRSEMRGIVVLLVDNVDFEDGSTFSDEKTVKALQRFLDSLDTTALTQN